MALIIKNIHFYNNENFLKEKRTINKTRFKRFQKGPQKQESTPAPPNDRDAERRVVVELGDSAGSAGRAGEALLGGREQLRDAELCVVAERWISWTRRDAPLRHIAEEQRGGVRGRRFGKRLEALRRVGCPRGQPL